ncbi:MAG: hypothetical protein LKG25_00090 [Prevotella sp.]|jgi:hypothetical protein|nr:hypothetical protein [Prevotella sp.]MCI1280974.1 hypothetical protein [Prevotella sp.]
MKKIVIILFSVLIFSACHESLEDRAAREAKEYTQRYCPTPVNNFTRTDSVVFEKPTRTYHYYCTFSDKLDDAKIINVNRSQIREGLLKGIKESTDIKAYKEAGFIFEYTCRSAKNPSQILFDDKFSEKDYH